MARKVRSSACPVDMTPMIDVVFQLIIFFIVTITLNQELNEEIKLEWSDHGPELEKAERATIIEVDRHGRLTMHGAAVDATTLRNILKGKRRRVGGNFPVLIRADYRTQHRHVRAVMDICTQIGIWQIDFVAMQRDRGGHGRPR